MPQCQEPAEWEAVNLRQVAKLVLITLLKEEQAVIVAMEEWKLVRVQKVEAAIPTAT
jgi:hypothetical protein